VSHWSPIFNNRAKSHSNETTTWNTLFSVTHSLTHSLTHSHTHAHAAGESLTVRILKAGRRWFVELSAPDNPCSRATSSHPSFCL